jgi:hypothetical protein
MTQDSHPGLLQAISSLAAQDALLSPPRDLERQILARFGERRRPRARAWGFGLAAVLAAAVLVLSIPKPKPAGAGQPFSPLPYAAPAAPYEQLEVRRQSVPVAALIAAGFDVHLADSGGLVTADVLVGQDGRPLAVRLSPEEEN